MSKRALAAIRVECGLAVASFRTGLLHKKLCMQMQWG